MSPIDWNKSPLRNPLGEDTPSTALIRRWNHRILYERGWLKVHWLMMLGILYLAGIFAWRLYADSQGGWNQQGIPERYATGVLVGLFILIRFQLATVPALLVCADTKKNLWEHFRITLAHGDDVAGAMAITALNRGAIPFALVSLPETLLYLWFINTNMGTASILLSAPAILLVFAALGMALTAFGMIGALVRRNPMGVVAGVLLPVALALLAAGNDFLRDFVRSFGAYIPRPLGDQPATLFLSLENRLAFSGQTFSRHGFTIGAGTDPVAILQMALWLGVFATLAWIALWLVLRYRLRMG